MSPTLFNRVSFRRVAISGFTLIEVIIVFTLIGILSGVVMFNLSFDQSSKALKKETQKLLSLIQLAEEEAIFQGKDLGIEFYNDGYRFLVWEAIIAAPVSSDLAASGESLSNASSSSDYSESDAAQKQPMGQWIEPEDRFFKFYTLPDKLSIYLEVEQEKIKTARRNRAEETQQKAPEKSSPEKFSPQLLILSSGEVTAAKIEISHQDHPDGAYFLKLNTLGQLTMEEPNAKKDQSDTKRLRE